MTTQSDTREALLEKFRVDSITQGALRAIARKGAAATMQDIADESGIAKGTLYLYFKDRDELLHRVSHDALNQLMAKVEEVLSRALPFDNTIRELVLTVLRFFDERRDLYRVNFEVKLSGRGDACGADQKKMAPPEKQQYLDRLARYFEEHVETAADAPRLALFFSETISALLFRRIPETAGPKLEEDAEFLSSLLLNGLSGKRKKS